MTDEIRQTVRLSPYATTIVREKATKTWPELENNVSALINRIVADWDRIREEPGAPATRVNARLERLERALREHGIDLGNDNVQS